MNTAGENVTDADVRLAIAYAYRPYSFRHHLRLCRLTIDLEVEKRENV